MSTTIENRVVEMQFDNKQFERNVETSLSTLDRLKRGLNLSGAAKGLENVTTAAKGVNLSAIGYAAETVGLKFNAMYIIADQALRNITNSAVNAGKRIVSALTVDPIKTGFQEYETQINAIQTILSNTRSKGSTLEDVNEALDQLNTYADKTIYNFTEMTRNIGTFTAAGVDLDTSVNSIKGIANLAAVSGSTSQQASTAMYQLSQALAAGKVQLMDWNSVVNAGMGGQVFQDALKRTAKNLGTNVDAMIEKYGSFRESLTKGQWLTAEVLTETLTQLSGAYTEADLLAKGYTKDQAKEILALADDAVSAATKVKTFTQLWDTLKESAQSGWTQTWELIVGDFEQARATLTKVSDVIGEIITESADARNALIKGWKENGGRDDVIKSFKNIFEAVKRITFHIKSAFTEIFPPVTVVQLVNLTRSFAKFTEKLKLSGSQLRSIKSVFKGVFALIDIGRMAFVALWDAIKPLLGGLSPLGGMLLKLGDGFGKWAVSLRDSIKESDFFNKALQTVTGYITTVVNKAKDLYLAFKGEVAKPSWMEPITNVLERAKERLTSVKDAAVVLKEGIVSVFESLGNFLTNCSFFKVLQTLWDGLIKIGIGIGKALGTLTGGLFDKLSDGSFIGFFDTINTMIAGGVGVGIMKFLDSVTGTFTSFKDIVGNVVDIFDGIRGCFEAYQSSLKAEVLMKIAKAIALLAAAIVVISLIDSKKLSQSLGAITILFADLMGSMAIFGKFTGTFKGVVKACTVMKTLAGSLLVLAIALKILSTMSWKEMGVGLISMVVGLGALVGAVNLLPDAKVKKAASAIKTMSGALVVLAVAIKIMSTMSWKEMGVGLISMVVGLGALVAAVNLIPRDMGAKSLGMITMASAMVILGAALKIMGSMSWKEMGVALISISGSLAALVVALNLMKTAIPGATAMLIVAPALIVLAAALKIMGSMNFEEVTNSLIVLSGSLMILTIALKAMTGAIPGAAAMLIVAPALVVLASALKIMGSLRLEEVTKSLIALSGSMLILTVALNAMNGAIPGAAAMLVVSAALAIFTPQLLLLGSMSWESIGKGLLSLAGIFVIVGAAGLLLSPIAPAIAALGAAIAAIGIGTLAAAAGLLLAAAGVTALGVALSTSSVAIMAGISVIVLGLADLIPAVAVKLAEGIVRFAQVIADGAPVVGEAYKNLILTAVDVLVECIPAIADGALKLIVGVLEALVKYTPTVVNLLFDFIVNALQALADRIPDLIQVAFNLIMSIFTGVMDALKGMDVSTLVNGTVAIGIMSGIMVALSAVAALVPGAMVGVLGIGAVIAEMAIVLAAIGALAQIPGLDWLIGEGGQLLQSIGTAIGQFVGGIVGGVAQGITASLPQIGSDLSEFITNATPFIEGVKMVDSTVLASAGMLAGAIIAITAADIISGVTSFLMGGSSFAEFGSQLAGLGTSLNEFATNLGSFDEAKVATVDCAVRAIKAISDVANELPNEGGWLAKLVGDNSIATFGGYLPGLGTNLSSFASNLGTFTDAQVTTVNCAANAIKAMATAASEIPNEGGWAAKLFGDNSIAAFAAKLPLVGLNLSTFAKNLGTFTSDQASTIDCALSAIVSMAEASNGINGQADWAKKIFGDNGLAAFSGDMPTLGSNLSGFVRNLGTFNDDTVSTVRSSVTAIEALSGLAKADLKGAKKNIEGFGEKIVEFATDISSFCKNMPTGDKVTSATSNLQKILDMTNKVGTFNTGTVNEFTKSLDKLGKDGVQAFVKAFTSTTAKSDVKKAAAELTAKAVEGANSKLTAIKNAFKDLATDGAKAIKEKQSNFKSAGSYLVDGFVAGISENLYKATAQARAMALAAKLAAEEALGIASPSKVFYKIGAFTGEGFVNALSDYGDASYKAGSAMANFARNGLTEAISNIDSVINDTVDMQPTIRPVVDLTGVQTGANAIGDLLNTDTTMGVAANVRAINSSMNQRIQNGDNSDVVSAINKLRSDMANVDRASYNINGISYDDGSEVSDAIKTLVRHAKIERRT